jgi:O-methyltransferase involved in polyketide biosynthesis
VRAVEKVVSLFLEQTASAPTRQILNLGGGFDTTFLKLKQQGKVDNLVFVEVDFPPVIQHKLSILKHARATRELLALNPVETYQTSFGYSVGGLTLVATDLKDTAGLLRSLQAAGVARNAPTLVITECVLVYMEQQHQQQLVQSLKGMFEDLLWVSYDMVNPDDEFGRVMRRNLSAAGFRLPGLLAFPSLRHQVTFEVAAGVAVLGAVLTRRSWCVQEERFKQAGFEACGSQDMHRIFHEFIPQEDIPR